MKNQSEINTAFQIEKARELKILLNVIISRDLYTLF